MKLESCKIKNYQPCPVMLKQELILDQQHKRCLEDNFEGC